MGHKRTRHKGQRAHRGVETVFNISWLLYEVFLTCLILSSTFTRISWFLSALLKILIGLNVVRFRNYLVRPRVFHTKKVATLPGLVDLRETILHWGTLTLTGRLNFLTMKHGVSCGRKLQEGIEKGNLRRRNGGKTTHWSDRGFTFGLRGNMWHKQGTRGFANRVKDAMLDAEKSFEEVRQWSDTHKQDFIPMRNLRDKLKQVLRDFEKKRIA